MDCGSLVGNDSLHFSQIFNSSFRKTSISLFDLNFGEEKAQSCDIA